MTGSSSGDEEDKWCSNRSGRRGEYMRPKAGSRASEAKGNKHNVQEGRQNPQAMYLAIDEAMVSSRGEIQGETSDEGTSVLTEPQKLVDVYVIHCSGNGEGQKSGQIEPSSLQWAQCKKVA